MIRVVIWNAEIDSSYIVPTGPLSDARKERADRSYTSEKQGMERAFFYAGR